MTTIWGLFINKERFNRRQEGNDFLLFNENEIKFERYYREIPRLSRYRNVESCLRRIDDLGQYKCTNPNTKHAAHTSDFRV